MYNYMCMYIYIFIYGDHYLNNIFQISIMKQWFSVSKKIIIIMLYSMYIFLSLSLSFMMIFLDVILLDPDRERQDCVCVPPNLAVPAFFFLLTRGLDWMRCLHFNRMQNGPYTWNTGWCSNILNDYLEHPNEFLHISA